MSLHAENISRWIFCASNPRAVLLDKIIELATDTDKPLSVLLRQCVVACLLRNPPDREILIRPVGRYPDCSGLPETGLMPHRRHD